MEHPDPKKHQLISFIKSGVRIMSSAIAAAAVGLNVELAIVVLAVGYGVAEIIGVYEELV